MNTTIPSAAEVRARLQGLNSSELEALANKCSVPLPTLVKIKYGQTVDPRIETVRAIWGEIVAKAA